MSIIYIEKIFLLDDFFDKLGEYIRIIQKNVYLCLVRN